MFISNFVYVTSETFHLNMFFILLFSLQCDVKQPTKKLILIVSLTRSECKLKLWASFW